MESEVNEIVTEPQEELKEPAPQGQSQAPVYLYMGTEKSQDFITERLEEMYPGKYRLLRDVKTGDLHVFIGYAEPMVWHKVQLVGILRANGRIRLSKERLHFWKD